jgi:hypothetical protein
MIPQFFEAELANELMNQDPEVINMIVQNLCAAQSQVLGTQEV